MSHGPARVRIDVLGSGSAEPCSMRKNASILIGFPNGQAVLVDCSGSPLHELLKRGHQIDQLDAVVLTHAHVDHLYALPSVVHGRWLHDRTKDCSTLTVHGTREALDIARQLIDAFRLSEKQHPTVISWRECSPTKPTLLAEIDGWSVRTVPVSHSSLHAVGVMLDGPQRVLITGDTVVDEQVRNHLSPAVEHLIADCGGGILGSADHAGALQWASSANVPTNTNIYLTHLPANLGTVAASGLLAAFRPYESRVRILADGDTLYIP